MKDYVDRSRLGRMTRARVTLIMNLLNLAPEMQVEIFFLHVVTEGNDKITERQLRNCWWQKRIAKGSGGCGRGIHPAEFYNFLLLTTSAQNGRKTLNKIRWISTAPRPSSEIEFRFTLSALDSVGGCGVLVTCFIHLRFKFTLCQPLN